MTGTDLEIIPPVRSEIAGADAERMPTLHTTARKDSELLAVWLKSHADGSPHTRRAYERIGQRFTTTLERTGTDLRHATVDHVQTALEAMRTKEDGTPASAATVNSYVAAVKSCSAFAQVGYTRFNAAPLIKLRKAPRQLAQRLMSEFDTQRLIHAAEGRDRLMLEVAYYGALRVSELVSLTWGQLIPRDSGELQIEIVGKGQKSRQVLLPAELGERLLATRAGAAAADHVFRSQRAEALTERGFNYVVKGCCTSRWHQSRCVGALAAPRPCLARYRQRRAGHACLADARPCRSEDDVRLCPCRPNDSSSRYLKK